MKQFILRRGVLLALAAVVASCTMQKQEAPSLTGPSEFGKSLSIVVDPDSIQQDGVSSSTVNVTALGANGEPLADRVIRAEIRVDGILTDFGTLSPRSGRTNAAGKATFVYTAPPTPTGLVVDAQTVVQIGITPSESDFANSATRFVSLRLLPPGKIQPPSGLALSFDTAGTTTTSTVDDSAIFTVIPPPGVTIVRYTWNFGDGSSTTTGLPTATHTFRSPGSFVVSATAEDTIGRTGSASSNITVAGPPLPEADFVFSPTNPAPGDVVHFNASTSTPSPGRTIVGYAWDFGNGQTGSGVAPSTIFPDLRSYTVTLTVTDDRGRIDSTTKTISVVKPSSLR
jgi:hypothetical protein